MWAKYSKSSLERTTLILTHLRPFPYDFLSPPQYALPMIELGYALSSEEHDTKTLVAHAARAEAAGFTFALISDHYHPWISHQGQSPFVWATLGSIAQATKTLRIGTGVTCPIVRIHPAIIAQAAATVGQLFEGRFFLGVGTGENLNEHVVGQGWPPIRIRQLMLREAIDIIRLLWEGENTSYYGEFFTVEDARVYSLPQKAPELYIAASGPLSATLAGELGDGFIGVAADKQVITAFEAAGGAKKPKYGQMTVCVAETEAEAVNTAITWWPNGTIPGQFGQETRLPVYFEQTAKLVTPEQIKQNYVLGSDPEKHLKEIKKFVDAGFDHIYVHQVGPDQERFFRFYEKEILPRFGNIGGSPPKTGRGRPRKVSQGTRPTAL